MRLWILCSGSGRARTAGAGNVDLFGFRFAGHPDLRRILPSRGLGEVIPLRKDYIPWRATETPNTENFSGSAAH